MTITAATAVFPNNAVNLIQTRLQTLDAQLFVCRRPLRASDPEQSVGIFSSQWLPDEDSYEMRNGAEGRSEPSLSRYGITIQALIKDMDEENGQAVHSVLSKLVRSVLYRDEPLRVGLAALSITVSGSTERTKRWGIATQRYLANEISGNWIYLSTLDFWLETETI